MKVSLDGQGTYIEVDNIKITFRTGDIMRIPEDIKVITITKDDDIDRSQIQIEHS